MTELVNLARAERVACAVDLAEPSRVAMHYAADLARRLHAELTLVHVCSRASIVADDDVDAVEAWRAEAEARAGVPVTSRTLLGDPLPELLRYAAEDGCDLLVVGTHGREGVPRVLLGSVAERLVRACACPVLVVRDRRALERADEAEELAQYR